MRAPLKALRALVELDAKELFRDYGVLFFTFVFPLFFIVAIAVQSGHGPAPVRVGLVGDGAAVDELAARLGASGVLAPERFTAEAAAARRKKGELSLVLYVPPELRAGATVRVVADPIYAPMAEMALDSARLAIAAERGVSPPFAVQVELTHAAPSGFSYVFPGILALALLQLGLFGTATPLLRARDRGTLRHLSTTPAPRLALIASQLIVRLVVSGLQMVLLIGVGLVLAKQQRLDAAHWLGLAGATLLGALALIALGYAVAGLPSSVSSGTAAIVIVNFACLFGSGLFVEAGRSLVERCLAYALPLTYVGDLFRQVLTGAHGLFPVWLDALALGGWTVAAVLLALRTFKFEMAK
jgi:ABC-2 type transport system permease protein